MPRMKNAHAAPHLVQRVEERVAVQSGKGVNGLQPVAQQTFHHGFCRRHHFGHQTSASYQA